ncbi:MAG: hypothetical protein ACYCPS_00375 [Candidatus Saccharimonadales bacterium]
MRAISHSLTGALIGLTVIEPAIAVPAAFISHFALDALPHYGHKGEKNDLTSKSFAVLLISDTVLCIALVIVLAISKPIHWPLAAVCAFVAAAPDFFSVKLFYRAIKRLPYKPGLFVRFASAIQWFEKPIGLVVELTWVICILICLSFFIKP